CPDVSFCRSSKPCLIHHCLLSGSPKSRDSSGPQAFKSRRVVVIQSQEDFMLLINNQEVEKLFTMKDCLDALEDAYDDLLKGDAVYRPRLDLWMPCDRADRYYRLGPTA